MVQEEYPEPLASSEKLVFSSKDNKCEVIMMKAELIGLCGG